jgi:hypothetical protein
MEHPSHLEPLDRVIEVHLTANDFEILEKYRGQLTTDAFLSTLLRLIDSDAVSCTPRWVGKKGEGEAV